MLLSTLDPCNVDSPLPHALLETGSAGVERTWSGPLLDAAMLATLRDCLGEADLRVLMTIFPDQVAKSIDDLKRAAAANDLTCIREAAHTLAGMSINLGATRLADIARYLSNDAVDILQVSGPLRALDTALDDTREMIAKSVLFRLR